MGLPEELEGWLPPFYLKAPHSTAGLGVCQVTRMHDCLAAFHDLRRIFRAGPFMVQRRAQGQYAQVQALFDHGRLVAAYTSGQTAVGVGGSAAVRLLIAPGAYKHMSEAAVRAYSVTPETIERLATALSESCRRAAP